MTMLLCKPNYLEKLVKGEISSTYSMTLMIDSYGQHVDQM